MESNGSPGLYSKRPDDAKLAFVRICSHYFAHDGFLEDGALIRDAGKLAGIPGILIHGRTDLGSPVITAWELAQAWPGASAGCLVAAVVATLAWIEPQGRAAIRTGSSTSTSPA